MCVCLCQCLRWHKLTTTSWSELGDSLQWGRGDLLLLIIIIITAILHHILKVHHGDGYCCIYRIMIYVVIMITISFFSVGHLFYVVQCIFFEMLLQRKFYPSTYFMFIYSKYFILSVFFFVQKINMLFVFIICYYLL